MRVTSFALGLVLTALSGTSLASVEEVLQLQARGADANDGAESKKPKKAKLSDAQIRKILIEESIAAYSGNCPCPYSTMRNGRTCGRRSAYSREGGESPLCYAKDVTSEMVQAYRTANPD
jgi:hypothetical protein